MTSSNISWFTSPRHSSILILWMSFFFSHGPSYFWYTTTSSSSTTTTTTSSIANAFVVLSRQSTNVARQAFLDLSSRKIVSTGFSFRPEFAEITAAGQADTQCFTSLGDARGFDRILHDTPQLCLGVVPGQEGQQLVTVSGLAGRQGILYQMSTDFQGTDYNNDNNDNDDNSPLFNPFHLPLSTYPVDMISDANGGVYVGLHDTGGLLVPQAAMTPEEELGAILEYLTQLTRPGIASAVPGGVDPSPLLLKVNMTTSQVVWQTSLETVNGESKIGGMVYIPASSATTRNQNLLVVAGSSNGIGSAVGANVASSDWDGYITLVDADTGYIDDSAAELTHITADHSIRIQSQFGQNDYLLGICALDDKIFVVGSTTGKMSGTSTESSNEGGGAFILKLDIDTLNILWKVQISGDGVEATQCVARGGTLYVGGHVPMGIILEQDDVRSNSAQASTSPTQDVFAAAIDVATSQVFWARQIDSRREDRLCSIMISANGNLLLMGNGMDTVSGTNDAYLMTVSRQGGIHDWLYLPQDADPINGYQATTNTNDNDIESETDNDIIDTDIDSGTDNLEKDNDDNQKMTIVLAVLIPLVVFILVAIYGITTAKERGGQDRNTSNGATPDETNIASPPVSTSNTNNNVPEAPVDGMKISQTESSTDRQVV